MTWRSWIFSFFFLILFSLPAQSFTFAVFGDSHENEVVLGDILGRLNGEKELAFAIHTGDMVNDGSISGYYDYLNQIKKFNGKIYQVPGNHDLAGSGYRQFRKSFGPYYYSFDHENAHFIVLNNAFKGSFDSRQFKWLKQDLAETRQKHIFVFMHRPLFDPAEIYDGYVMSGAAITRELMALFTRYKVDYVFAGHIHAYAKEKRDGVTYIVNGGAGGRLHLPENFGGYNHYVRIEAGPEKIVDRVIKLYE